MASIRRHPVAPSRWQVRYRDPSGRQRTKNFAKKSDARKYAAWVEAEKLKNEWIDPRLAKTDYSEWAQEWLATKVNL